MSREDKRDHPFRTNGTLYDIKKFCEIVLSVVEESSFDDFLHDLKTQSVIILYLINIGEAVKKLGMEFRNSHTEINWTAVVGMRNILVHRYYGIDYQAVWDVVVNHIPELLEVVRSHLDTYGIPDSEVIE
jgi:uncharacterized protein with HEPN domain